MTENNQGVFFPNSCGLSERGIVKKTEEFRKCHEYSYKIPLKNVIDDMGGEIIIINKDKDRERPLGVWGAKTHIKNFKKFDNQPWSTNSKFYIAIDEYTSKLYSNKDKYNSEINFLLAQLLGHYVLHYTEQKKMICEYQRGGEHFFTFANKIYLEAFIFALNLLMPEDTFIREWERVERNYEIDDAKYTIGQRCFSVPDFAVDARIENLKLRRSWFNVEEKKKWMKN